MNSYLLFVSLVLVNLTIPVIAYKQSTTSLHRCQKADLLFINGKIITMDQALPYASAVAVKDGKIINVVGPKSRHLFCNFGKNTKVVNLKGKTLTPGFIDSHSHFSMTAVVQSLGFSISPPPFGSVSNIPQMLQNAKDYITSKRIPAGQKVFGAGYNDYLLAERRHPTRYELDWISTEHPIVFQHFSAHVVVANSLAISLLNITDQSTPPLGGVYDRFPNSSLTGVFKQKALSPFTANFGKNILELKVEQIQQTAYSYFRVGVTTAQDISLSMKEPTAFKNMGDALPIDINSYFLVTSQDLSSFLDVISNYSTMRIKHRGAKFILDGSIQAYTALLSQPYWVPQARQYDHLENYTYDKTRSCATESCGQNNFHDQQLLRTLFAEMQRLNLDVLGHCNGDAALDNFLDALSFARTTGSRSESRFVVIHSQTAREDQLDSLLQFGGIPSFFTPHLYYIGDQHFRFFLGPERANRMNPVKSAVRRGLRYTLHNDSPVIINDVIGGRNTFIEIMESAINRRTAEGRVLGEDQKLTPYEALAGVTINGAWQAREQDSKGSITAGKVADLVILSGDPLRNNTENFKDLRVLATLKEGKLVYGSYP